MYIILLYSKKIIQITGNYKYFVNQVTFYFVQIKKTNLKKSLILLETNFTGVSSHVSLLAKYFQLDVFKI